MTDNTSKFKVGNDNNNSTRVGNELQRLRKHNVTQEHETWRNTGIGSLETDTQQEQRGRAKR